MTICNIPGAGGTHQPSGSKLRCVFSEETKIYPLPFEHYDFIGTSTGWACAWSCSLSRGIFIKNHSGWNPNPLKLMAKTPKCFDETCLVLNSRLILQFGLLLEGKYPNLHGNIWDQMEQLLKYRKYICFGVSMHAIYNSRASQNNLYTIEIWDLVQKQSNCVVQVSALMREVITSSDLSVHCGNMQWNHFLTNKINLHSSPFLRMIYKLIYKVNRYYKGDFIHWFTTNPLHLFLVSVLFWLQLTRVFWIIIRFSRNVS